MILFTSINLSIKFIKTFNPFLSISLIISLAVLQNNFKFSGCERSSFDSPNSFSTACSNGKPCSSKPKLKSIL